MREGFATYPTVSFEELAAKIEEALPRLPSQEAKLAQFMLLNLETVGLETGRTLAARVGVSEVTVGRLLRRLGCDGMRGFKAMVRERYAMAPTPPVARGAEVPARDERLARCLSAEIDALGSVAQQAAGDGFARLVERVAGARRVYVTGFQSVRGLGEDFARRLAIARPGVSYLSPHDGMLAEWIGAERAPDVPPQETCLVLVDVVPYAQEGRSLARIARAQGRACVLVTDEYCHWAGEVSDAVVHAPSRSGLFLESPVGILFALGLIVDAVAARQPDGGRDRIGQWKFLAREMRLF